jgi:GNAT superfamily N-acetyltransferase
MSQPSTSDVHASGRLRSAVLSDVPLLVSAWIADTLAGHLLPIPKPEIASMITTLVAEHRYTPRDVSGRAYVLEFDGRGIGFAVIAALLAQSPVGRAMVEVVWLHIVSDARRRGWGDRLLALAQAQLTQHSVILVRCLPASIVMERLLLSRGFAMVLRSASDSAFVFGEPDEVLTWTDVFAKANDLRSQHHPPPL